MITGKTALYLSTVAQLRKAYQNTLGKPSCANTRPVLVKEIKELGFKFTALRFEIVSVSNGPVTRVSRVSKLVLVKE